MFQITFISNCLYPKYKLSYTICIKWVRYRTEVKLNWNGDKIYVGIQEIGFIDIYLVELIKIKWYLEQNKTNSLLIFIFDILNIKMYFILQNIYYKWYNVWLKICLDQLSVYQTKNKKSVNIQTSLSFGITDVYNIFVYL